MGEWKEAALLDELPQDTGYFVEIDGEPIALFRVGKEVFALAAACPHAGGPLAEGGVHGEKIMCPWHGWEFHVRTGACDFNPSICQVRYETRVEAGRVFVRV